MGTSKEPVGSPPAAVDQASIADQRMAGMWAAQRFHGMAPGKQTGSMGIDDYRNPRLPLPAQPGIGGISGPAGFGNGDPHFTIPTPHVPGSPWGGGGKPLLNSQWDPAQRMIEKGMQNYYQKTFELAVDYAYGSTATGKHHNVSPFETVIHHYDPGASSDGASGGGGEGITAEESARLHEQAIGAPSGYFASSREESRTGTSTYGNSLWDNLKEAGRDLWEGYNNLPWYVQVGIDLGLAVLEPGAMGEAAFAAKWAARMGWKFLLGQADNIAVAGVRAAGRRAAGRAAAREAAKIGLEVGSRNIDNVIAGAAGRTGKTWPLPAADSSAHVIGKFGEDYVSYATGLPKNLSSFTTRNGTSRIPDFVDRTNRLFHEAKNTGKLSYTRQLRDEVSLANDRGYEFVLWTRQNTKLSKPLQEAINRGDIIHKPVIPWY